jgi:hypothetical protein
MALDRTWYNALVDDDGSNAVGTVWGKDDIKNLLDSVDAEIARGDQARQYACALWNSVSFSWGPSVWAKVQFGTEGFDPMSMHAANDTEIWMPGPGAYDIRAQVTWPENNVGWRGMQLSINDATLMFPPGYSFVAPVVNGLGVGTLQQLSTLYYAPTMQRLSLQLYQSSGAAQNLIAGAIAIGVHRIY